MAFETELIAKMGERVDLDEVSLDMARYADRDIQEAIVNYLQKRQAKWQPDLVVPIGSSATIFVANYRDRLFPETPILYDSRSADYFRRAHWRRTRLTSARNIDLPGLLEDMLQVAPATKNIAVIVGATPLEHYWQEAFQKAAEPLAGRIKLHLLQRSLLRPNEGACLEVAARFLHFFPVAGARCRGCNPQLPTRRCNASMQWRTLRSIPSSITNWAWGSWVGAFTRARGSERRLRTSPFVFCMVNQLPVFLQDSSSVSLRVMTGASYSDGRLMRNSCRQEARSCSASRRFGIATGHGS